MRQTTLPAMINETEAASSKQMNLFGYWFNNIIIQLQIKNIIIFVSCLILLTYCYNNSLIIQFAFIQSANTE